jgi:hypothetical protein
MLGHDVDHSRRSSAEIKLSGAVPLLPPCSFMTWTGTTFLFLCLIYSTIFNLGILQCITRRHLVPVSSRDILQYRTMDRNGCWSHEMGLYHMPHNLDQTLRRCTLHTTHTQTTRTYTHRHVAVYSVLLSPYMTILNLRANLEFHSLWKCPSSRVTKLKLRYKFPRGGGEESVPFLRHWSKWNSCWFAGHNYYKPQGSPCCFN